MRPGCSKTCKFHPLKATRLYITLTTNMFGSRCKPRRGGRGWRECERERERDGCVFEVALMSLSVGLPREILLPDINLQSSAARK